MALVTGVFTAAGSVANWAAATPAPEIDPNRVTPGIWGFLSFVFLIGACVFLYYSMRKQLKRVKFDENAGEAGARSVDVFPVRRPAAASRPEAQGRPEAQSRPGPTGGTYRDTGAGSGASSG